MSLYSSPRVLSDETLSKISKIHSIVSSDVNDRGMKHLIVEGDFLEAAKLFARLLPPKHTARQKQPPQQPTTLNDGIRPTVLLLSGFPCLIHHDPPTETDGPNGTFALAYCAVALGYRCVIVTDQCNAKVFEAGLKSLMDIMSLSNDGSLIEFKVFEGRVVVALEEENEMKELAAIADLIVACERAGPASDGNCYTMRGIDMTSRKLIAPLHRIIEYTNNRVPFIGIGDGGNELGMGKVIDKVKRHIPMGETIGCIVPADYLIAASVSNWGAYALCGAAALIRADDSDCGGSSLTAQSWIKKCLFTEEADLNILKECMKAGCRDGVNGRLDEPFVDGMPAEKSSECFRAIRNAAFGES